MALNEHDFMIDLIKRLKLDVVIVTKNYLGSLNHTFSTIKILRNYNIKIKGLIFNETSDKDLENFISSRYKVPIIARIKKMSQINETQIKKLSLINSPLGVSGIWPEVKIKSLNSIPCEYTPIASGASFVLMTILLFSIFFNTP